MRITGWILLIAGAALCATWVWATIGFLLMGIGLLSLLAAENKRARAGNLSAPQRQASPAPVDRLDRVEPVVAPPPIPQPAPVAHPEASAPTSSRSRSYDRQAWQQLVDDDADLARIAAVLADYGQSHVDELAKAYLAEPDKARLPEIVDTIVARAGQSAPRSGRARLLAPRAPVEASPPDPVAMPEAAAPTERQAEPLPQIKPDFSENTFVFLPVEPSKPEVAGTPVPPQPAVEPEPAAEDRSKTIVSADAELSAMLGKLAPAAANPKS